jgi:hypothetical protein
MPMSKKLGSAFLAVAKVLPNPIAADIPKTKTITMSAEETLN